jgi:hypothetical protein
MSVGLTELTGAEVPASPAPEQKLRGRPEVALWACWLTICAVALAGCGGGSSNSNGVADLTPTQIITEMQKAVSNAKSVHITGTGSSGGTEISLDLQLAAGKGGTGYIEIDGYRLDLVRVGNKLYIKADKPALNHFAGSLVAGLLGDKWFVIPSTASGFGSFSQFTDLNKLMKQVLTASGRVEKGSESKIDDQPVIALTDTKKGGTLYVATTGPAYPIELAPGGNKKGKISFTDWDQPVKLTAPSGALDYQKLTGG